MKIDRSCTIAVPVLYVYLGLMNRLDIEQHVEPFR